MSTLELTRQLNRRLPKLSSEAHAAVMDWLTTDGFPAPTPEQVAKCLESRGWQSQGNSTFLRLTVYLKAGVALAIPNSGTSDFQSAIVDVMDLFADVEGVDPILLYDEMCSLPTKAPSVPAGRDICD